MKPTVHNNQELKERLRQQDINPTTQRLAIARVLFAFADHVSTEEVFERVNAVNNSVKRVSKATVYNTLGLFADRGFIRRIIADPARVFYDPNVEPHHHFYDVDTHTLTDIEDDNVRLRSLPALPEGVKIKGVDVIVRVSDS